ncbi:hypothetical protein V6N13_081301 [Hibiscus sabdariffa]
MSCRGIEFDFKECTDHCIELEMRNGEYVQGGSLIRFWFNRHRRASFAKEMLRLYAVETYGILNINLEGCFELLVLSVLHDDILFDIPADE